MGYWSTHPLAGDAPSDVRDRLLGPLDSEEGFHFQLPKEQVGAWISEHLPGLLAQIESEEAPEDFFVLPFIVAEHRVRIADAALSEKIREMIGDGGAKARGYEEASTASAENNWNGFAEPGDYAAQLYALWPELMAGTVPFEAIGRERGLFEEWAAKASEAKEKGKGIGLINVR